tara:strand:+ start:370 stop:525 length:156 start_codon:yes stop_codon:yes gene_type:complete
MIPHGNFPGLTPTQQVVAIALAILFGGVAYGIYLTFGPPSKNLIDPYDHDD